MRFFHPPILHSQVSKNSSGVDYHLRDSVQLLMLSKVFWHGSRNNVVQSIQLPLAVFRHRHNHSLKSIRASTGTSRFYSTTYLLCRIGCVMRILTINPTGYFSESCSETRFHECSWNQSSLFSYKMFANVEHLSLIQQ